jgi:membrane protease YdiL (CAAX protease family)
VLAYGVTWLLWSPVVFLGLPVFSPTSHAPTWYLAPAIIVGVTGVAFLMTAVTQGRPGVRRLLQRVTDWRVGLRWYAVAILLIPVVSILVAVALGSPEALRALTPSALLFYPAAYFSHFFFGPLFEESGWRGFALPRMQHRFGPLRGTLLLGLLWSAWHFFLYVPMWFAGGAAGGLSSLLLFTVLTTSMAFLFTWLLNNARASLLVAFLMHGSVDGTQTYLQVLADKGVISADASANSTGLGLVIACVLGAVVLVAVTRGRLSYPRYQTETEPLDLDPGAHVPASR